MSSWRVSFLPVWGTTGVSAISGSTDFCCNGGGGSWVESARLMHGKRRLFLMASDVPHKLGVVQGSRKPESRCSQSCPVRPLRHIKPETRTVGIFFRKAHLCAEETYNKYQDKIRKSFLSALLAVNQTTEMQTKPVVSRPKAPSLTS